MAKTAADRLFTHSCEFFAGAMKAEALPPITAMPEIAFAGKSNVGKSSLLNALTGRKTLARTSQTPGRTRQLNFFNLSDRLTLVDLPGYGYAKASKKDIAAWTQLTREFLCGRSTLRRVCLLIDSRRGITQADEDYMSLFDETAVAYQIILTKCDKSRWEELDVMEAKITELAKKHPACMPQILRSSSLKGGGIDAIRAELASLAL